MEFLFQLLTIIASAAALTVLLVLLYWPVKKFLETIYIGWALFAVLSGFMGFVLMQQTPDPDAMFLSILDTLALMQLFNVKLCYILLTLCPIALIISISRVRFESNTKPSTLKKLFLQSRNSNGASIDDDLDILSLPSKREELNADQVNDDFLKIVTAHAKKTGNTVDEVHECFSCSKFPQKDLENYNREVIGKGKNDIYFYPELEYYFMEKGDKLGDSYLDSVLVYSNGCVSNKFPRC